MEISVEFELEPLPITKKQTKKLIQTILSREQKEVASLTLVVVSNEKLREINVEFLQHDYETDVIAFNLENENEPIEAEVYVSGEQAKLEAKNYNSTWEQELLRYVCHGTLHTLGYEDNTTELKNLMHQKEDFYLSLV